MKLWKIFSQRSFGAAQWSYHLQHLTSSVIEEPLQLTQVNTGLPSELREPLLEEQLLSSARSTPSDYSDRMFNYSRHVG